MEQIINKIRLVLFKHLEVQKLVEVMNEIRDELRETENTSNPVEAEVMQKIKDYVDKYYNVEWDKMGSTGADDYWETATRDELYSFGRFRAFEDIKDFIVSNFSA